MNVKNFSIISFILLICFILGFSCLSTKTQRSSQKSENLANTPPMGWNSFDSYGVYLHDAAALANLYARNE